MRPGQRIEEARINNVDEAPRYDQNRIIGIELSYRDVNGNRVELEMFACKHTLPYSQYHPGQAQLEITAHMSQGDRSGVIQL